MGCTHPCDGTSDPAYGRLSAIDLAAMVRRAYPRMAQREGLAALDELVRRADRYQSAESRGKPLMSGLRDILEAATSGEWWVDADEENLDVRAVEHAVARVAGAMTMEPDADPGVKARALADASLMALAPELAALVLDMRETLAGCLGYSIPMDDEIAALLARLDQLGKEPSDG